MIVVLSSGIVNEKDKKERVLDGSMAEKIIKGRIEELESVCLLFIIYLIIVEKGKRFYLY